MRGFLFFRHGFSFSARGFLRQRAIKTGEVARDANHPI